MGLDTFNMYNVYELSFDFNSFLKRCYLKSLIFNISIGVRNETFVESKLD